MDAAVTAGPWLAPGLTAPQRIAKMEAHAAALGWRVALRGRWVAANRSWADPVFRALRLRRSWTRYAAVDACLLAHELAHAVQAEGGFWRRVWWGLRVRDIDGRWRLNLSSWTPGDPVEVQDAIVARSSELMREAADRWVP